jgi:hypothetical protein
MRTDRTYFERHSTRPQGGKEDKKKKAKKKSVPALNTVDGPSTPFPEFRGLEEVEEMSNEIG